MKAIIEGKLETMLATTEEIYVEVLNVIIDSNNEQELRNNMNLSWSSMRSSRRVP